MKESHYLNNDIPVSFEVFNSGKLARLDKARIKVYGPKGEYLFADDAETTKNEVSYIIGKNRLPVVGTYSLEFDVWVNSLGMTSHYKKLHVVNPPIKNRGGKIK